MKKTLWTAAFVAVLGLVTPVRGSAQAAEDAKDTATETGRNAKKSVRKAKPGDETAADRREDAKDTAVAQKAKSKKKARHAKNKAKKEANEAKANAQDATK